MRFFNQMGKVFKIARNSGWKLLREHLQPKHFGKLLYTSLSKLFGLFILMLSKGDAFIIYSVEISLFDIHYFLDLLPLQVSTVFPPGKSNWRQLQYIELLNEDTFLK